MRYIDGDHKPVKSVQETRPEKIAGKKGPERIDQDLIGIDPLALLVQQLGGQPAITVVLVHMLIEIGIGMMQQVSSQVA